MRVFDRGFACFRILTELNSNSKDFSAYWTKHNAASIIETVALWVPRLESPNNEVRPGSDARYYRQDERTRDQPNLVESPR